MQVDETKQLIDSDSLKPYTLGVDSAVFSLGALIAHRTLANAEDVWKKNRPGDVRARQARLKHPFWAAATSAGCNVALLFSANTEIQVGELPDFSSYKNSDGLQEDLKFLGQFLREPTDRRTEIGNCFDLEAHKPIIERAIRSVVFLGQIAVHSPAMRDVHIDEMIQSAQQSSASLLQVKENWSHRGSSIRRYKLIVSTVDEATQRFQKANRAMRTFQLFYAPLLPDKPDVVLAKANRVRELFFGCVTTPFFSTCESLFKLAWHEAKKQNPKAPSVVNELHTWIAQLSPLPTCSNLSNLFMSEAEARTLSPEESRCSLEAIELAKQTMGFIEGRLVVMDQIVKTEDEKCAAHVMSLARIRWLTLMQTFDAQFQWGRQQIEQLQNSVPEGSPIINLCNTLIQSLAPIHKANAKEMAALHTKLDDLATHTFARQKQDKQPRTKAKRKGKHSRRRKR